MVGRWLALCSHPYAAWRRHSVLITASYFGMAFVIALGGLFIA